MTSKILERGREDRPSKSGGVNIFTLLVIEWTYHAEDGSFVTSTAQGEAMDSSDKGSNKAMSVSQKYAIIQTFSIPIKEGNPDPDKPNQGSDEELEIALLEIQKFESGKDLADWANGQTSLVKNVLFVQKVKERISTLNKKGK